MNDREILEFIKEYFVSTFEIPEAQIKPEARLAEDLGLDSIDALDMSAMLEDQLNIRISEDRLKAIRSIEDVIGFIRDNAAHNLN
jgi:acyl carrier protein